MLKNILQDFIYFVIWSNYFLHSKKVNLLLFLMVKREIKRYTNYTIITIQFDLLKHTMVLYIVQSFFWTCVHSFHILKVTISKIREVVISNQKLVFFETQIFWLHRLYKFKACSYS